MRENRLSGLEGGVAFGPSLPLSFVPPGPQGRGTKSALRAAAIKFRKTRLIWIPRDCITPRVTTGRPKVPFRASAQEEIVGVWTGKMLS